MKQPFERSAQARPGKYSNLNVLSKSLWRTKLEFLMHIQIEIDMKLYRSALAALYMRTKRKIRITDVFLREGLFSVFPCHIESSAHFPHSNGAYHRFSII